MIARSIVKSVLTLQPGYSLRALNNKAKLTVEIARQWPARFTPSPRTERANKKAPKRVALSGPEAGSRPAVDTRHVRAHPGRCPVSEIYFSTKARSIT